MARDSFVCNASIVGSLVGLYRRWSVAWIHLFVMLV